MEMHADLDDEIGVAPCLDPIHHEAGIEVVVARVVEANARSDFD
jgi:hypothetical protein